MALCGQNWQHVIRHNHETIWVRPAGVRENQLFVYVHIYIHILPAHVLPQPEMFSDNL